MTEVSEDFYAHPEMDDISFPVYPEVVVLEPPVHNKKKKNESMGISSRVVSRQQYCLS